MPPKRPKLSNGWLRRRRPKEKPLRSVLPRRRPQNRPQLRSARRKRPLPKRRQPRRRAAREGGSGEACCGRRGEGSLRRRPPPKRLLLRKRLLRRLLAPPISKQTRSRPVPCRRDRAKFCPGTGIRQPLGKARRPMHQLPSRPPPLRRKSQLQSLPCHPRRASDLGRSPRPTTGRRASASSEAARPRGLPVAPARKA